MLGFLGKVSLKGTNQEAVPLNRNGQSKPNRGLLLPRFSKDVTSHFSWTTSGFFNERFDKGLEEQKCWKLIVHVGTVC